MERAADGPGPLFRGPERRGSGPKRERNFRYHLGQYLSGKCLCTPGGISAGTIRHARRIADGLLHPASPADIPLPVSNVLEDVAYALKAIRGEAR